VAGSQGDEAGEHGAAGLLYELAAVNHAGQVLADDPYFLIQHILSFLIA
jgi:hypothetical protein